MSTILICLFCAAMAWSFTEYALHHWVFHRFKLSSIGNREHLRHHAKSGYFTGFGLKLKMACLGGAITFSIVWLCIESIIAMYFTSSFGMFYVIYERIHYLNHMAPPTSRYGRWARKHHFGHHFEDARFNHGVTSPLWDLVFNTHRRYEAVKVPKKFVLEWMIDEHMQIRDEYRADYQLR